MTQARSSIKPISAVMVVGGGIAGMQAALDLADQGFKVYLVEEKSAIGGHMAQLDKTFPTNDCAMCNISPRLVDVGRHLNIEILTDTDVLGVAGQIDNYGGCAPPATLHRCDKVHRLRRLRASVSRVAAQLVRRAVERSQSRVSTVHTGGALSVCDRQTRHSAVS
jgi:NADPH-dependent 2,4-dienoyl-CoA reductase/sulfur reductase-like enzyme